MEGVILRESPVNEYSNGLKGKADGDDGLFVPQVHRRPVQSDSHAIHNPCYPAGFDGDFRRLCGMPVE
jgi:hypothetical protein